MIGPTTQNLRVSNFEDFFFAMNHARLQAALVQLALTNAPCFEDVALQGLFL